MKIVYKKEEKEDWQVGDVIRLFNSKDDKFLGLICQSIRGYAMVSIDDEGCFVTSDGSTEIDGDDADEWASTIEELQDNVCRVWRSAKKVNATLLIDSKEN